MANKFTQGKKDEALSYPKTLAEAVFLEENGESIKRDIAELPINGEVLGTALCLIAESIKQINHGLIEDGSIITAKNIAKTDTEVMQGYPVVAGTVYAKFLKSLSDTNEEIVGTALSLLNIFSALASCVAPPHSVGTTYSVGDIVSKDGRFYECVVENTGLWNIANWEQTTITDYVKKYYQPITQ